MILEKKNLHFILIWQNTQSSFAIIGSDLLKLKKKLFRNYCANWNQTLQELFVRSSKKILLFIGKNCGHHWQFLMLINWNFKNLLFRNYKSKLFVSLSTTKLISFWSSEKIWPTWSNFVLEWRKLKKSTPLLLQIQMICNL